MSSRVLALVALAVFGLAACGEDAGSYTAGSDEPPDIRVVYDDESMDLPAETYCYGDTCVDAVPPQDPPDVGSPEQLIVEFPLDEWTFQAFFRRTDHGRPREHSTKLEELEPGRFVLRPTGQPATYDVTLWGRGPEGDTSATFRWTTPSPPA